MVLSSSKGWPCQEPASNLSSAGPGAESVARGPGLVPLPDLMVKGISAQTEATPRRRTKECSVSVGTQDRLCCRNPKLQQEKGADLPPSLQQQAS